jgi:hypothetical protein
MPVSYQTIKLSRGKHASPEDGACVMELASMLAGESFSDHPASVCPVIGSFLRAYNDALDDDRRQDLYAYAAKVVGSTGSADLARARTERLIDWGSEMLRRRLTRFLGPAGVRLLARLRKPPIVRTGGYAVRVISKPSDETHVAVLALIDELLAIDPPCGACSPSLISEMRPPPLPDAGQPASVRLGDAALAWHRTHHSDRARRRRLVKS